MLVGMSTLRAKTHEVGCKKERIEKEETRKYKRKSEKIRQKQLTENKLLLLCICECILHVLICVFSCKYIWTTKVDVFAHFLVFVLGRKFEQNFIKSEEMALRLSNRT